MKILSAAQSREADKVTIANQNTTEKDLMERAGKACFDWIFENAPTLFPKEKEENSWAFHVICGPGNNGGDGLIIAKNLLKNGYSVKIYALTAKSYSKGYLAAETSLGKYKKEVIKLSDKGKVPNFPNDEVVIDCLFGTGLTRPLEGTAALLVNQINQAGCHVVSIDVPSGLFADGQPLPEKSVAVEAEYILSFQSPKLAFLLPENERFVGRVVLLDIQLDVLFLHDMPAMNYYITGKMAASLLLARKPFGHKGTFGTALVVAGSRGSIGAAVMTVGAAARAGTGMVIACVPQCGLLPMQIKNPEAKVITANSDTVISDIPVDLSMYDSIGIGPGIGTAPETAKALKLLLQTCKCPLVLDADALNILAENTTWLAFLPAQSILTPHPGEFKRLVGKWTSDEEKLQLQREFCRKNKCYMILKGRYSSVCLPDGQMFFNSSGNSGMATAGSGDVLTGILSGLLASGYSAAHAAVFATYLHGKAGDVAADKLGPEAMLATDIIDNLAFAFKQIALEKHVL